VGDITDPTFVDHLLRDLTKPAVFLNLCSDIDTMKLRLQLSRYPVAYIDSGASGGPPEMRSSFIRTMRYTNSPCNGLYPHLLCQGINPGMVEFIARRIMRDFSTREHVFDVTVFEIDTLTASLYDGKVAVGWSPRDLVEEMMVIPVFEVQKGLPVESATNGSAETCVLWNNQRIPSRIVAHEDIWNLSLLPEVVNARFIYSLKDDVMNALASTPADALKRLMVPEENMPVHGKDTVIVTVRGLVSGLSQSLCWSVDHFEIWQKYGVNGVQYQTGKSILFPIRLLMEGLAGVKGGTYNAATLPITVENWNRIDALLAELGIDWLPLDECHIPIRLEKADIIPILSQK
jgi:hypothetical protein